MKWGIVSFIAVWVLWSISSRLLADGEGSPNIAIFYTVAILSGLLPGYIASAVSGRDYVSHSLAAGVAASLVLLLFWALIGAISLDTITGTVTTPIFLVILSVIGGVIAKLQGKVS